MDLKAYQQQALDTLERYIEALKEARKKTAELSALNLDEFPAITREQLVTLAYEAKDYPRAAWNSLREAAVLPGVSEDNGQEQIPEYILRKTASGEPIPHVCLKVPTGGGKTLLGVEAVRRLKIGTGFLLWLVPTRAIYTQTWTLFGTVSIPIVKFWSTCQGVGSNFSKKMTSSHSKTLKLTSVLWS